jgi:hypothetical protein
MGSVTIIDQDNRFGGVGVSFSGGDEALREPSYAYIFVGPAIVSCCNTGETLLSGKLNHDSKTRTRYHLLH